MVFKKAFRAFLFCVIPSLGLAATVSTTCNGVTTSIAVDGAGVSCVDEPIGGYAYAIVALALLPMGWANLHQHRRQVRPTSLLRVAKDLVSIIFAQR